jgi:hypothetical protein
LGRRRSCDCFGQRPILEAVSFGEFPRRGKVAGADSTARFFIGHLDFAVTLCGGPGPIGVGGEDRFGFRDIRLPERERRHLVCACERSLDLVDG